MKYPDVKVKLVGQNGNAFFIISRVSNALMNAGVPKAEVDQYREEAMSGDYDNVLATTMAWVSVE